MICLSPTISGRIRTWKWSGWSHLLNLVSKPVAEKAGAQFCRGSTRCSVYHVTPHVHRISQCVGRLGCERRSEGGSCPSFCLIFPHYCWVSAYCPNNKRNSHKYSYLTYVYASPPLPLLLCLQLNVVKGRTHAQTSDHQFKPKMTRPGWRAEAVMAHLLGKWTDTDSQITCVVAAFLWFRFTLPWSQTERDCNESEGHPWG